MNSSEIVIEYIEKYRQNALELFHVVKRVVEQAGMNDVARMGIGSFNLFNMVVYTILEHTSMKSESTFGELLVAFLEFWYSIDAGKIGTSIVEDGSTYDHF